MSILYYFEKEQLLWGDLWVSSQGPFFSPSRDRKEPDLILFQEDGSELQGLAGALEDPGREDLSVVGAPGPAACALYLVVEKRISHDRASALQSRIASEHVCQVPPPQRVCCAQAAGVQCRGIRKAPKQSLRDPVSVPVPFQILCAYISCGIQSEATLSEGRELL